MDREADEIKVPQSLDDLRRKVESKRTLVARLRSASSNVETGDADGNSSDEEDLFVLARKSSASIAAAPDAPQPQ